MIGRLESTIETSDEGRIIQTRSFPQSSSARQKPLYVHYPNIYVEVQIEAQIESTLFSRLVRSFYRHSGELPVNPDDESLVRVERRASLHSLSAQLLGASHQVRALFLYLHLLAHVGQALGEFCRNVTHATGVRAALELLLLNRAGVTDSNESLDTVLGTLAAVNRALMSRIESSWLHWDLVSSAKTRLSHELGVIQWRDKAESRVIWGNRERMAADFLPELGADFFVNLYALLERSRMIPFWARCFMTNPLTGQNWAPRECSGPPKELHLTTGGVRAHFLPGSGAFHQLRHPGDTPCYEQRGVLGQGVWRQKSDDYLRNKACLHREHALLEPDAAYDTHSVLRAALAVRATLEAVEASPRPLRSRFDRQTFFQRVCFLTCSRTPDQAPASGELPPRLRCNLAVRNTPLFHAAFFCDPRRRLARAEVCELV
ncbi:hypothetical protein MRX96_029878 [Rhipicephalus microplus]